jgi:hypothetical protein
MAGMTTRRTFTNGDRFGRLVVVRAYDEKDISLAVVRCDCGVVKSIPAGQVKRSKSCGCLAAEHNGTPTHGMVGTTEYNIWHSMKARCYNPNNKGFKDYGGRGIKVYHLWHEFKYFYRDMGPRPSPEHTLGRINNDGNYEPSNCRWETVDQQSYNKRNTRFFRVNGKKLTTPQAAAALGVKIPTLRMRVFSLRHRIRIVRRLANVDRQHIDKAHTEARKRIFGKR